MYSHISLEGFQCSRFPKKKFIFQLKNEADSPCTLRRFYRESGVFGWRAHGWQRQACSCSPGLSPFRGGVCSCSPSLSPFRGGARTRSLIRNPRCIGESSSQQRSRGAPPHQRLPSFWPASSTSLTCLSDWNANRKCGTWRGGGWAGSTLLNVNDAASSGWLWIMFEEERNGGLGAGSPTVSTPANLPTKRVQKPLHNKMRNEALNQRNCEFNLLAWMEKSLQDGFHHIK